MPLYMIRYRPRTKPHERPARPRNRVLEAETMAHAEARLTGEAPFTIECIMEVSDWPDTKKGTNR